MTIPIIVITILMALFSTSVMSYIAMATPIGPWIAPTIALICMLIFKMFLYSSAKRTHAIALATIGGSIGGIIAIACGFSYPTLYFLDPTLFNSLMAQPVYFVLLLFGLVFCAGALGFVIATLVEENFIVEQEMAFPIGVLVHKMIVAQNQAKKALELVIGFFSTMFFCFLQGGFSWWKGIIPHSYTLINCFRYSVFSFPQIAIKLDILPMLLAIGFITGHVIAVPLLVGAFSKMIFIDPLQVIWFSHISSSDFLLAFCSGMVVCGTFFGFISMPKLVKDTLASIKNGTQGANMTQKLFSEVSLLQFGLLFATLIGFLWYCDFSVLAIIYLLIGTCISTYQIAAIAGKIGLAQLGRFATFVMVPAMFIFKLTYVQLTIVATFVEICGGVATDLLFGRKLGRLAQIDKTVIRRVQFLGLLVSALSIGVIFWVLINHFGLGSDELFAQRAQARALLINVRAFNYYVLLFGALFGYTLSKLRVNPMLVLGGILMPINYSLGLIVGGMLTYLTKDRESWDPFWSGVFAANSIWELLKAVI